MYQYCSQLEQRIRDLDVPLALFLIAVTTRSLQSRTRYYSPKTQRLYRPSSLQDSVALWPAYSSRDQAHHM
jgi:hypothetical protein